LLLIDSCETEIEFINKKKRRCHVKSALKQ